jgi:hypothetical protein
VLEAFPAGYHWSLQQAEYATDIVFRSRADLASVYDALVRTAIYAVKAEDVATFLGRKVDARYTGELGTDSHTRIQGTRVKHHMGKSPVKMYDKFGRVLRLETITNDVSFFKHYREVVQRDGSTAWKLAPVKKSIYSLLALAELLAASNRRYLEFLSSLDDVSAGARRVDQISRQHHPGRHASLSRLQCARPAGPPTLRDPRTRRIQHQRFSEPRPAPASSISGSAVRSRSQRSHASDKGTWSPMRASWV